MKSRNRTFSERCYSLLRRVPRGKVVSYQDIAHALGSKAYRAVGQAMHRNPYAPKVPCHRCVCADGRVGGFANGSSEKIKLLRKEGIECRNGRIVRAERYWFSF